MADTFTIKLPAEAADRLRRLASEHGQTAEEFAGRLVEDAADELSKALSPEQLAELQRRMSAPSPLASPERTAETLRKFGLDR